MSYELSEGEVTVQFILFEKYQVESIVYESDTATVYKVVHLQMSACRIIKKILKKSIHQNSFYSEINILKSIRHPGIPIIYDVEEDNSAYYIVEEYIEGVNLAQYIEEKGVLSQEEAVDIGIKICEIVSFLHGHRPVPILFLDIHPKNILINEGKVSLVDFGNSFYSNETQKRKILLGTVGYAAPEQYTYEKLDERTDIYGIGSVLYYMVTGRSCQCNSTKSLEFPDKVIGKYRMIVSQCLSQNRSERFNDVAAIARNLREITKIDNEYDNENEPLIISVVGASQRVGATHVSLLMALGLAEDGHKVIYEEENDSNDLRKIAKRRSLKYKNGYFYEGNLMLKPSYGPQVHLWQADCKYVIRDYGAVHMETVLDSDLIVLCVGVSQWELDDAAAVCSQWLSDVSISESRPKLVVLANMSNHSNAKALWGVTGHMGIELSCTDDVFSYNRVPKELAYKILEVLQSGTGGELYKKKTGLFGRIKEKAKNSHNRNNGDS